MKYAAEFTVSQEESINGKMALHAMCNRMEQVASANAEAHNVHSERLVSEGYAWALVRLSIKIKRMPEENESYTLHTWPVEFSKVLFSRDFYMTDADGNDIMRATSEWAVLNLAKRRACRIPDFLSSTGFAYPEYIMSPSDYKIPSAEDFPVLRITHANDDDIDINDHVNNVRYVKWIERAVPENVDIKSFEIIYKKEALLGDQIFAKGGKLGDSYIVSLYRKDGEIVLSRINGLT